MVNVISQQVATSNGCGFPNSDSQPFYDTATPTLTSCYVLDVVQCPETGGNPYLPTIRAYVGVTKVKSGHTSKGLIMLFAGAGGTLFFNFPSGGPSGVAGTSYASEYHAADYTIAQIEWRSPWNNNASGIKVKSLKEEGCRPATLMRWLNDNVSQGGFTCAQGHSAGAAGVAYALEFYGADRNSTNGYLNQVLFTSGPTESDIKGGCQYPPSNGTPISVCAGNKCVGGGSTSPWNDCLQYTNASADCFNPPNNYIMDDTYDAAEAVSNSTIHDTTANGNNCNNYDGQGDPTTAYDSAWAAMSLVTGGAANGNVQYSKTWVSGFLCSGPTLTPQSTFVPGTTGYTNLSNNSAAQAWGYLSLVQSTALQNFNGTPNIYRVDYCEDPEMIWAANSVAIGSVGPMSGFDASKAEMINNCKIQH